MIAWFTATRIGRWLAGAAAAIAVLFAAYFAGSANRAEKTKRRDAERALDTKEKVDEALRDRDVTRPVDERLRERGRLRD